MRRIQLVPCCAVQWQADQAGVHRQIGVLGSWAAAQAGAAGGVVVQAGAEDGAVAQVGPSS